MTEDDLRRVQAAPERTMAQASAFFEGLTPEQIDWMQACSKTCGEVRRPAIDLEETGTVYEQSGWMPKADYMEMQRIISDFEAGDPIADTDFATMLRILAEGKEAIVRVRLLAFLGEPAKRNAPRRDRIARIEEAIAPYRDEPEDLDLLYWASVRQAIDDLPA